MSEILSPKQTLLLWSLLGAGGQAALPKTPTADHEALIAAGLALPGFKPGVKAAWIEVTDAGWDWAGRHLGDPLPTTSKVLHAWLARLAAYLQASGTPLADLFVPAPEPLSREPVPKPKAAPRAKAVKKPKAAAAPKAEAKPRKPSAAVLKKRILEAYKAVTGGRLNARATLDQLRANLPDLDRATLDAALVRLHETDKKATLMRLDNPRDITPAVRDAQILFKGEPMHLLWIDP